MAQRLHSLRAMVPRFIAMTTLSLGLLLGSAQAYGGEVPKDHLPTIDQMVPPSDAPIPPAVPPIKASGSAKKPEFLSYRQKIIVGLVASDLVIAIGFGVLVGRGWNSFGPPLMLAGIGGHLFTGPIVHWSRGHLARGFGSLALYTLVPPVTCLMGGFMGSGIQLEAEGHNDSGDGFAVGAAVGLAAGAISAAAIDIGYLAQDPPSARDEQSARALPMTLSVVPIVGANQWGVAVVGRM